MAKMITKTAFTIGLLVMLMAVPALGATINKSVKIEAGGESDVFVSIQVREFRTLLPLTAAYASQMV